MSTEIKQHYSKRKRALFQNATEHKCVICYSPAVLIMRIYYGTVDNECNVHALVGGIIHQVGQVAEAKDCNSIQPGSFQSSAQCTDGTRSAISTLLLCQSPPTHKKITKPPVKMVKYVRQHSELKPEEVLSESDASMDQQDFGEMSDYSFSDVLYSKCSAMDQIGTFMKNVQVLLDAANYIENIEKNNGSK